MTYGYVAQQDWWIDSALGQMATALVMGPYQAIVALVWLLGSIARGTTFIVRENTVLLVRFALIVGVVVLCCMVWQLAVGGALIAAYGWMMKPKE